MLAGSSDLHEAAPRNSATRVRRPVSSHGAGQPRHGYEAPGRDVPVRLNDKRDVVRGAGGADGVRNRRNRLPLDEVRAHNLRKTLPRRDWARGGARAVWRCVQRARAVLWARLPRP